MEVEFPAVGGAGLSGMPENSAILESLKKAGVENAVLQPTGERGLILRMKDLDEKTHQTLLSSLKARNGDFIEKRFDSIGPTIGKELRRKSLWAILFVLIMIVAYISWTFREVSKPMSSWKYGLAAIAALIHDVSIPTGVFAVLGRFYGVEVDTLFVTALLTILGFSVHDTIVVFDRIRENLKKSGASASWRTDFEAVVEKSVKDTVSRSINTSLTVLFVMLMLYFLGGATIQYFALAIIIGVFFGVYSSIFIASALLVTWHKWTIRKT